MGGYTKVSPTSLFIRALEQSMSNSNESAALQLVNLHGHLGGSSMAAAQAQA